MRLTELTGVSENEPVDRLGRIAAAMLKTAEEHPEHEDGDKVIVMLDDRHDLGMVSHSGYEKDEGADAFMSMLAHLSAVAEANGMQLNFVPMLPHGDQ